jgi:hypothetical protein
MAGSDTLCALSHSGGVWYSTQTEYFHSRSTISISQEMNGKSSVLQVLSVLARLASMNFFELSGR